MIVFVEKRDGFPVNVLLNATTIKMVVVKLWGLKIVGLDQLENEKCEGPLQLMVCRSWVRNGMSVSLSMSKVTILFILTMVGTNMGSEPSRKLVSLEMMRNPTWFVSH